MNIKWNANKYTEDFSFVHQYGNSVTELIEADINSTVIDLGCGNGALSNVLKEKGFDVIGIDASKELLDIAKKNYPDMTFIEADATEFSLEQKVDIVFSNAVFHWIDRDKQPAMLSCVYQALKTNGQFVFEFGGNGNNNLIHDAVARIFSEYGYDYRMPFYFPTIGEYSALLERAGFKVRYATLFDRLTELKGEDGLKEWINMFLKTPFSVIDNPKEKEVITDKVVSHLQDVLYKDGKWYADHVRIRMKAIKE